MNKIEEFKVYKTKNFGNVKVLKKTSISYKPKPGKVRVKILDSGSMDYIGEEEFIFPAVKSKLTAKERKETSRQRKKEAGKIETLVSINKLYFEKIHEKMPNKDFSEIVEFLIKKTLGEN